MKNSQSPASVFSGLSRPLHLLLVAVAILGLLTGCPSVPRSGPLVTPTFSALEIPLPTSGSWQTVSTSAPPFEVLPTRGRLLRIWFYAPVGSSFDVALRAPGGALTALAQNHGAAEPPETGYFRINNVNVGLNPPLYTMEIRPPAMLANFDVLIVNKSLRTDVTDSLPLIVRLAPTKVFTVTVQIVGAGHVTSTPPGIQCGTSATGRPMSPCSFDFGSGTVSLFPAANDLTTTKFTKWSGNCDPNVQVCTFTLNGAAPVQATATFEPRSTAVPASTCQAAPLLPGLRWIDLPHCATGMVANTGVDTGPARCDVNGFFCCKDGALNSTSARCGAQKIEFPADCIHKAPRGMLIQPGGCYEVNGSP